jgi:perosamine synthetase
MDQHEPNTSSRRTFLKATTAAALAAGITARPSSSRAAETLALGGGAKAVTFPAAKISACTRWPRFGDAEKKAVMDVLDLQSGAVYRDLPVFEKEWCEYHGNAPFAKCHMNGTSALTSMYFAMDFPPGSEIMVPTYTFFGTILAMRFFGLVPIFIDIDPKTATFDVEHARKQLTPNTKAVVAMHSWGLPCDMDAICAFAKEHGLMVCEDAAHAHGAKYKGKHAGTIGEMSIYSMQATKPLPAIEGGMGMYQKREHYERASVFGHYEDPAKLPKESPYAQYVGTGLGLKLRINPMSVALGRMQLKSLDERNGICFRMTRRLNDRITQLPGITEPFCPKDVDRVYYSSNVIFFDEAKAGFSQAALLKALGAEGVHASNGDYPCQHKYKVYSEAKWWHHAPKVPTRLPGSEQVNATAVNLPLFHDNVEELVDQYIVAFEKIWAHKDELAKLS